MKKVTLSDVAREAGLGPATVERVLNGRGGVRPATIERVIRTARKLNYDHKLPAVHRGAIRVEVILVRPETTFYSRLNQAFERIAASLDKSVFVHRTFVRENDPVSVADYIANPSFRRSALIAVVPDHPRVVESLRQAQAAGVEVVQVMTRPAPELAYVGIDNYAAGRTVAHYLSRMTTDRQGSFVALCHSGAYENHKQRIRGFSDYLSEHKRPHHCFSHVMFGLDDDRLAAGLLRETLKRSPDLIGLYTAGGGNSPIALVLEEEGAGRNVLWVGHELTEQTKRFLRNGVMAIVLDQAPEVQARRSLDTILSKLGMVDVEISREPVRFLTITSENT